MIQNGFKKSRGFKRLPHILWRQHSFHSACDRSLEAGPCAALQTCSALDFAGAQRGKVASGMASDGLAGGQGALKGKAFWLLFRRKK
jgi:hypothetical protein